MTTSPAPTAPTSVAALRLEGASVTYPDGRRADDISLVNSRDDAVIRVDLRFLDDGEQTENTWVKRSAETALLDLFLLEKAAYEICYEAANRPAWLPVRSVS